MPRLPIELYKYQANVPVIVVKSVSLVRLSKYSHLSKPLSRCTTPSVRTHVFAERMNEQLKRRCRRYQIVQWRQEKNLDLLRVMLFTTANCAFSK